MYMGVVKNPDHFLNHLGGSTGTLHARLPGHCQNFILEVYQGLPGLSTGTPARPPWWATLGTTSGASCSRA